MACSKSDYFGLAWGVHNGLTMIVLSLFVSASLNVAPEPGAVDAVVFAEGKSTVTVRLPDGRLFVHRRELPPAAPAPSDGAVPPSTDERAVEPESPASGFAVTTSRRAPLPIEAPEEAPERKLTVAVTIGLRSGLGPSLEIEVAPLDFVGLYVEGTVGLSTVAGSPAGRGEIGARFHPQGRGAYGFYLGAFVAVSDYDQFFSHVHQLPGPGAAFGATHAFGAFALGWQLGVSMAEVTTTRVGLGLSSGGYFPGFSLTATRHTATAPVFESRFAIGFNI